MMLPRFAVGIFLAGMTVLGAGVSYCQNYPNKSIRIITSGVGGGNDFVARLIAQGISSPLGQQVIVENRASGVIPGELVSQAQPDGYTLLVYGGTLWIGPLLQKTSYDALKSFSPITLAERAPNVLAVFPSSGVNSVKELIALAKAKPGALNYASTATGSSTHLTSELFKSMAGVDIVRVPYKSVASALTDLMGGQVQMMFTSPPTVAPHMKSGRLRVLAVTSPEPSALAPGLPTVAAAGVPGFESVTITGIFAPATTPKPVIDRLNREIVRFVKLPETKEKFLNTGSEAAGTTPEELAAAVKAEVARWGKVIKDAGLKAD